MARARHRPEYLENADAGEERTLRSRALSHDQRLWKRQRSSPCFCLPRTSTSPLHVPVTAAAMLDVSNSLFRGNYSLKGLKKFPVPLRREFFATR